MVRDFTDISALSFGWSGNYEYISVKPLAAMLLYTNVTLSHLRSKGQTVVYTRYTTLMVG